MPFLHNSRHVAAAATLALFLALANSHATSAQEGHEQSEESIGAVHFPTSCNPAVQADFDRAVALLHHMMYVESRRAFEEITLADPECAMAHWGIAMTLFQPLWPTRPSPVQLERGWQEVERAKELTPETDRERAYVAAAEAFYLEPETADWWTRIARWAAAMETVYEAYSNDLETAAFYALSHLAAGQIAEDRLAYHARAAEVLLAVYAKEPTHPGAIHYTIHANDVSERAGESLDVVSSYDNVAPSVPHALHMPTHIYVRLGNWPAVIEWNRKSADAALLFPAGDAVSGHYPHAIDYLIYAYLQQGEDEKAHAALQEAFAKEKYEPIFSSAFHLAAMPARYAVERRDWAAAAALPPTTPADLPWDRFWWAESLTWFARGLGAVRTGDIAAADEALERMQALRDGASAAGEGGFATYIDIDLRILAAWRAAAQGDSDVALDLARSAVDLEATIQKHAITPGTFLPPYEALGDLLMSLGRSADAMEAYEKSLQVWPARFNSLLGAARAARESGDGQKAAGFYGELAEMASGSGRPELEEARSFRSQTSQARPRLRRY